MRARCLDLPMLWLGMGYVGVRVDMRGNGESDGIMLDEYLAQEQQDALEVIDWLTDSTTMV